MKRNISGKIGDSAEITRKISISAVTGDFKKTTQTMTEKGLLCEDAVLAIAPQVREYHPSELGLTNWDKPVIRLYTPSEVLFSSSVMDNIDDMVDNHPEGIIVTPDNWEKHSIGMAKKPRRVGDELRADLIVKDKKAIKDIQEKRKVELSLGYEFNAMLEAGKTDDGQEYDAIITSMKGDHVALVKRGRGGERVRIGDEDKIGNSQMIKIMINGQEWEVDVANAPAFKAAIEAQQKELSESKEKLGGEVTIGDKQFKVTDVVGIQAAFTALAEQKQNLETEKAELEKTAIKPEDLERLATERAETVTDAKALKPDLDATGKSVDDIKAEAVEAHVGDSAVVAILKGAKIGDAKPDQVDIAFRVLSATRVKDKQVNGKTGDSNDVTSDALNSLNNDNVELDAQSMIANAKANAYKGAKK